MPLGGIIRSLVNLRSWLGSEVNALVGGRVDVRVGAVAAGVTGTVKSVQRGYSSVSVPGAGHVVSFANAVVVNKSAVVLEASVSQAHQYISVEVTSPTEFTIANALAIPVVFSSEWQVVEFY